MAAFGGKDFILKLGDGGGSEVFTMVGGLRATSMSINAEAIDVTHQGSAQWKTLIDGAGIKSVSISGSGVFEQDSTIAQIRTDILAQTLRNFQIVEHSSGDYFQGKFKITSMERAGDYDNEQSWSISLESSGAITYTAV